MKVVRYVERRSKWNSLNMYMILKKKRRRKSVDIFKVEVE